MRKEVRLVSKAEKDMSSFFASQRDRYLSNFKKYGKIEVKGFDELDEMWATVEIIEPMLYQSIMGGQDLASKFFSTNFKPDNKWISQWIARLAIKEARLITETTQNELINVIKEGSEAGDSIDMIKDRVKEVFTFASDTRAKMIARTEVTRGIGEGQRRTYAEMGYVSMKWILSNDACDICQDKANQEWDIDTIEGEQPVHPNCSCSMCPKGSLLSQLD